MCEDNLSPCVCVCVSLCVCLYACVCVPVCVWHRGPTRPRNSQRQQRSTTPLFWQRRVNMDLWLLLQKSPVDPMALNGVNWRCDQLPLLLLLQSLHHHIIIIITGSSHHPPTPSQRKWDFFYLWPPNKIHLCVWNDGHIVRFPTFTGFDINSRLYSFCFEADVCVGGGRGGGALNSVLCDRFMQEERPFESKE